MTTQVSSRKVDNKGMDTKWNEIMKPLAASPWWPAMRVAAEQILASDDEDEVFGISSSDVNHTVFCVANCIARSGANPTPRNVLDTMLQMVP